MDHAALSMELLRAWRGERSQVAFSRRLRYRTNVAYLWETGRRSPTASRAFAAALRIGVDVRGGLERFWAYPVPGGPPDLTTRRGVAALLQLACGSLTVREAAARAGTNRFTMSRWLTGKGEPRLPELLRVIDGCTERLLDFVACFSDPGSLPSAARAWRQHQALQSLAFEHPWSEAVSAVLELEGRGDREPARWASELLGISHDEAARCVVALRRAGMLRYRAGRARIQRSRVDHRLEMDAARTLKLHWQRELARRVEAGHDAMCSYIVFAVSEHDAARARQLQLDYYEALLQLAGQARSPRVVAVAVTQLAVLARSETADEPVAGRAAKTRRAR